MPLAEVRRRAEPVLPSSPMAQTDAGLLNAWLEGDPRCGEVLLDRHFGSVRRFFCNKVPAPEVEDLMQQTFAACIENAARYRGDGSFLAYLLAIANSQLHRWIRKRDPIREGFDAGCSSVQDLGLSPSALLATRDAERHLLEALQRLPLDLQTVLELHYWEGLGGAEIADIVGIPHGTVRSRLHRARNLLREQLIESSSETPNMRAVDTRTRALGALLA